MQETLIAVHTRRATYDRDRAFTAWLFAIARYKMIDHFRRNRRIVPIEGLEEILVAEGFEDAAARGWTSTSCSRYCRAKQARMIRATRIDGLSVAEAADGGRDRRIRREGFGPSRPEGTGGAHPGRADDEYRRTHRLAFAAMSRRSAATRVGRRLALGIAAGALVSICCVVVLMLGVRPDLGTCDARLLLLDEMGLHHLAVGRRDRRDGAAGAARSAAAALAVADRDPGAAAGRRRRRSNWSARRRREWLAMWLGHSWKRLPVAGAGAGDADLHRAALVVPAARADAAARGRRGGRAGGGRVRRDGLLPALPRSVGDLRADLVYARHPARGRRSARCSARGCCAGNFAEL